MRPFGQIDADITVANARTVVFSSLQTTLCNYLTGVNCQNVSDFSSLPAAVRPDSVVDGQPAFHFTATFAAVPTNISPD